MDREFEFGASPKSRVCVCQVCCVWCMVWIGWRWGPGDEGVCVCVSAEKKVISLQVHYLSAPHIKIQVYF